MGDLIELHPSKAPKICINCQFCNQQDPNLTWYEYYCGAPEVKRKEGIDPVTGKVKFISGESLADESTPFCRDINIDGKCRFFKPAKDR